MPASNIAKTLITAAVQHIFFNKLQIAAERRTPATLVSFGDLDIWVRGTARLTGYGEIEARVLAADQEATIAAGYISQRRCAVGSIPQRDGLHERVHQQNNLYPRS